MQVLGCSCFALHLSRVFSVLGQGAAALASLFILLKQHVHHRHSTLQVAVQGTLTSSQLPLFPPICPVLPCPDAQVVRRELADNYCHYCPDTYDSLDACYDWARQTLQAHAGDKREFIYTR